MNGQDRKAALKKSAKKIVDAARKEGFVMAKLNITTEKALTLPPKRLGEMLEPGLEYTGFFRQKAPCCDDGAKRHICVNGTLPTLAAAKDKPELLRFLLDRGHDVNGASQAATEALLDGCPPYEHPQTSPPPHPGSFQTQLLREHLAALFLATQDNARLRALVERFCRGCTVDLSASSIQLYRIPVRKLASGLDGADAAVRRRARGGDESGGAAALAGL